MADPHRIDDVETLREMLGTPSQIAQMKVWPTLDPSAQDFIAKAPFAFVATADAAGRVDVSPKGDHPGFVVVEDEHTLLVPDRKGNRLIFGLQNILANPYVSLIFLIPGTNETLRVTGRGELTRDPAVCARLTARGQPALLAIRVTVEECFFHCPKAFMRASLWNHETWPSHRVSFGAIFAPKLGIDPAMAPQIDEMLAKDAKENL
jgi:PPOX class probable FMN-dependent enzyme